MKIKRIISKTKDREYLLSATIPGKGSFIDVLSLYLIYNWHVRKDQSHVLFCDVAIAVEIVTNHKKSV